MTNQPTIKQLPFEQAMQIAAGEVIERPSNLAKELIENSLDAGATHIVIHIEQAGKTLFSITDNGIGMSAQDIRLCVLNHATSKINTVDDLQTALSFGFRGEALASINAVSKLSITSKRMQDDYATTLSFTYGKQQEESASAHQIGTTITVTELFGNLPARKKFLKSDETEYRAIVNICKAFCLQNYTTHFQLYNNQELAFNYPATKTLTERFMQIFDHAADRYLIPIAQATSIHCTLSGIISNPDHQRYDRSHIFVFVNNRLIKNNELTKAILKSYLGTLPAQRYPAAVLHLTIPTQEVDSNIHPKKEEVKLLHAYQIEKFITTILKDALAQANLTTRSTVQASHNQEQTSYHKPITVYPPRVTPPLFNTLFHEPTFAHTKVPTITKDITATLFTQEAFTNQTPVVQEHIEQEQTIQIIGQYQQTYILVEHPQGLMLVDQHAAHERILYEQFKKNFNNVATIQLLFPEVIKLNLTDMQLLNTHQELITKHGIIYEPFSETEIIIQAIPTYLKSQNLKELIAQTVSLLHEYGSLSTERFHQIFAEKMHAQLACKAAVKAGAILQEQEMKELIQQLCKTTDKFSCPHGRPTTHILALDDITKKFKRDYQQKAEKQYDFFM